MAVPRKPEDRPEQGRGAAQQRRVVHYSGEVQGVGFRFTALRLAGGYDVTGYVRNLPDGRVEIIVEGPAEQLDQYLQAIQERMGAYIGDVAVQVAPASGEFTAFNIRM